jgi:FkbM family methyltransferase
MSGFNRWKECLRGTFIYNINDQYVGRSLDLYGEFCELEGAIFRQLLKPGDVVVEVGANIGGHTVHLSQLVGTGGAVLAFEPQRIVFQTLCANMAVNSITNAHCCHMAVGRETGFITVPFLDYSQPNNFGGIALGNATRGERVAQTTLDNVVLERCRLIKVDVEGMEIDVLQGGDRTIAKLRPFLYVENDRKDRSDALIRYIDSLGYEMFWHKPPLYNPANYLKNPVNVFGNIVSLNMICIPRPSSVSIQGLPPVTVPGKA